MDKEVPLFPISLYIYNLDGTYGEPVTILSQAQLYGPGTQMIIKIAIRNKQEIRMVDPYDNMVFHSVDGKIVFPEVI